MTLDFDKKTKRWNILDNDGERWDDCTVDTVRQVMAQNGLSREETTAIIAQAKCVAYGIDVWRTSE
jgi:hypothetical protein